MGHVSTWTLWLTLAVSQQGCGSGFCWEQERITSQSPIKTCRPYIEAWKHHMGGPFLGTLHVRCRITLRTQKGTRILTTTHIDHVQTKTLTLVSREWRNGVQLYLLLLPFFHSLLTKGGKQDPRTTADGQNPA